MSYIKTTDIDGPVVEGKLPKATAPAVLSKIPNAESRLNPNRSNEHSLGVLRAFLEKQNNSLGQTCNA